MTAEDTTLASTRVWQNGGAEHHVLSTVALLLTVMGLLGYLMLLNRMERLANHGRRPNSQASFVPEKVAGMRKIVVVGPVMLICGLAMVCLPELVGIFELLQTIYKAYAYYALLLFIGMQFGKIQNLAREDGSGTLQQHPPAKLWNKPPCCCVWVWCLPFMSDHTITARELNVIFRLVSQYSFVGPVVGIFKIVAYYEGFSKIALPTLNIVLNLLDVASMLTCIYASAVGIAVADKCMPITEQVKRRRKRWSSGEPMPERMDTSEKQIVPLTTNLGTKNLFIVITTALPGLVALICSFAVGDKELDNNVVLPKEFYQTYIIGFCQICLNILGLLWAWKKAFPPADFELNSVEFEFVAAMEMQFELIPGFVLHRLRDTIDGVIQMRMREGTHIDFGIVKHPEWDQFVGHEAVDV